MFLYKHLRIENSKVVCVCQSKEECDKLWTFGWTATTVVDDQGNEQIDWMNHVLPLMKTVLFNKRIVLFPHQNEKGTYSAGRVVIDLVDKCLDIRIVNIPYGETLIDFARGSRSSAEAGSILEKLITKAIPITSTESWDVYDSIKTVRKAIDKCETLHGIRETLELIEEKFVSTQRTNQQIRLLQLEHGQKTFQS
jgi:IS1 family transposase